MHRSLHACFRPLSVLSLLGLSAWLSSCTNPSAAPGNQMASADTAASRPNIILLIGDGMGLSQVSSAFYFGEGEPNFARFPIIGLSRTSSSSHKITDSAAGATAFSAGQKTYNGAIGVDDNEQPLPNILEILEQACPDCPTGLVATSSITHATPASFFAHEAKRSSEEAIAAQMTHSPVDFFAGGGKDFFFHRSDGLSYYDTLTQAGFVLDTTALTPQSWKAGQKYGYLLAGTGMPTMLEDRGDFLPNATQLALDYLTQAGQPFFLMVEGSQIDWGGHENNGEYLVQEVLDFDKTLGVALDFAEKQGNTLVVVTADHETGGFTLHSTDVPTANGTRSDYDSISFGFSTGGHSGTLIPVFAYGPGAEQFAGVYQNTAIFDKMRQTMQLPQ
ncbi:alkaline phosphatase [Catalinimonas alkaloidigena]|uniref:Alkaline phosphatase n=1 Tax=Catalinimonas alkaloidigena TaxID=1075417 RepID=A0A1G9RLH7_9BACT|nr:alkaline phosphatase [Catalinimonas alkaloidigena]SDM23991.1 alkaline phosphatase [Catalinimonas alkaloidigena]